MTDIFEKQIPDPEMGTDEEWASIMKQARELPIEELPGAPLEERTVRELRRRGLLKRPRRIPVAWLAGSIAASLALFATGVAVGQLLATRSAASLIAHLQDRNDAASAAAQVQQTGTAYVAALAQLVNASGPGATQQDASHAREVALTALHGAANEIVRLAPNDPVVAKILQGIEQQRRQSPDTTGRLAADRQIVWF